MGYVSRIGRESKEADRGIRPQSSGAMSKGVLEYSLGGNSGETLGYLQSCHQPKTPSSSAQI